MAMSISQLGGIAGAPITADSGSIIAGEPSKSTVPASAGWRSPATSLRCAVRSQGGETDRVSPSPPVSPVRGGIRADLSVACQAFATEVEVVEHGRYRSGGAQEKEKGVPVYVMMPLDSVTMSNGVNRRKAMNARQFTGFCPLCLCERLTILDHSSSRPPCTSNSTLKSIFRLPISSKSNPSFFPELRRTQSFSAAKNEQFSGLFEPQRHSCDVRATKSFNLEQENNTPVRPQAQNSEPVVLEIEGQESDEITVLEETPNVTTSNTNTNTTTTTNSEEIVIEKSMKDHIDLDSQPKKSSGKKFWSAASVLSKKWQKWMRKQTKKGSQNGGSGLATLPVEKPISRQLRETQSEIADYGFGRRSCDTDPRFSLDVGRMSFDGPRYSFDEPRASWDGYLIGRNFPRLPPMVEDDPVVHVSRIDAQIPIVDDTLVANRYSNADEDVPGGSAQTRDYYLDSSSKRRKSLDRSSSIRKTAAAAMVAEIDDMKVVSNAKVTPTVIDYVNGGRELNGDRHLRELNVNSLRDDCSETFELGSKDNASVIGNNGEGKDLKKSRRWNWKILGFMLPRGGGNKEEDGERYSTRSQGLERSFSGSWQDGHREAKGEFNRKVFRSNSSVNWRNSYNVGGSFGSMRKSGVEVNGNGKKKKEEFVLERNQSARYSPNDVDNGLLRFYLTPLRGSRRGGLGKSRSSNSQSIARSVLRLY